MASDRSSALRSFAPLDPRAAAAELRSLFAALRHERRNDAAYCVAHAGVFLLGDAAPREVCEFEVHYHPVRPRRVRTPLDDTAWLTWLRHPDDDPYVGQVFASVLAPIRCVRTHPVE